MVYVGLHMLLVGQPETSIQQLIAGLTSEADVAKVAGLAMLKMHLLSLQPAKLLAKAVAAGDSVQDEADVEQVSMRGRALDLG